MFAFLLFFSLSLRGGVHCLLNGFSPSISCVYFRDNFYISHHIFIIRFALRFDLCFLNTLSLNLSSLIVTK